MGDSRLQRGTDSPEPEGRTVVSGNRVADEPRPSGAPTIRDAIRLIEKMDKCEGMPELSKLIKPTYSQASELDADDWDAEKNNRRRSGESPTQP